MELQLVNISQAKALKELGFPQEEELVYALTNVYDEYNQEHHEGDICYAGDGYSANEVVSAPSLELAAKWLRDEKLKIISIGWYKSDNEFDILWTCMVNGESDYKKRWFKTYEEALSQGIDDAIEFIHQDNGDRVITDTLDNLILKFEILNTQFQSSKDSVGKTFESFAKKNWDKVDMNYFDSIM